MLNDVNGYIDIRFMGIFLKLFFIKICIKEGEKIIYDFKCMYDI